MNEKLLIETLDQLRHIHLRLLVAVGEEMPDARVICASEELVNALQNRLWDELKAIKGIATAPET
jgi:hypothetical protein